MNDKIKTKAEYAPNEKKVWRGEAATQVFLPPEMEALKTDDGKDKFPVGVYFLAIEELQGAWIDGEWEEAGFDEDGHPIPRSRRYVLKRFTSTGGAENAFSSGYSGPRQYKK
jgi:hypothetical protein